MTPIRVVEKSTKHGDLLEVRFGLHSNEALNILDYYTSCFCSSSIYINFGIWNIFDTSKWIGRTDDGEIVCWCTSRYAWGLHRDRNLADAFTNYLLKGVVSARENGMHGIEKLNYYLMTGRADPDFKGTPLDPFVCASINALKDHMIGAKMNGTQEAMECRKRYNELMGWSKA